MTSGQLDTNLEKKKTELTVCTMVKGKVKRD